MIKGKNEEINPIWHRFDRTGSHSWWMVSSESPCYGVLAPYFHQHRDVSNSLGQPNFVPWMLDSRAPSGAQGASSTSCFRSLTVFFRPITTYTVKQVHFNDFNVLTLHFYLIDPVWLGGLVVTLSTSFHKCWQHTCVSCRALNYFGSHAPFLCRVANSTSTSAACRPTWRPQAAPVFALRCLVVHTYPPKHQFFSWDHVSIPQWMANDISYLFEPFWNYQAALVIRCSKTMHVGLSPTSTGHCPTCLKPPANDSLNLSPPKTFLTYTWQISTHIYLVLPPASGHLSCSWGNHEDSRVPVPFITQGGRAFFHLPGADFPKIGTSRNK